MILRIFSRLKDRLLLMFVVFMLLVSLVYFYLNNLKETYRSAQWSGERCSSELASVKYQLDVVTEYKNRMDKLLLDNQKAHHADKEKFKDMIESCVALKQQSVICQSQFDDLQGECKKVREDYDKLIKDSSKLKTDS